MSGKGAKPKPEAEPKTIPEVTHLTGYDVAFLVFDRVIGLIRLLVWFGGLSSLGYFVAVHRCSSCASQVRCARTTTLANGQPSALLATVPVCHPPRAG